MPGLFGVFLKTGRSGESPDALGRRMGGAMRHTPWLTMEAWAGGRFSGGRVHLGVLHPDPQPIFDPRNGLRFWIDGEFFPDTRSPAGVTPAPDEAARLMADGGTALTGIDGAFTLALYDEAAHELVLANDRLGHRPLYVAETPEWFAYAAEVKALLAIHRAPPDLDEISLRQFFAFDHFLGDRTWWQDITLLPPGSCWHMGPSGRQGRRYWSFHAIPRAVQEPEAVHEALGPLWAQEARRFSRPGTMPLLLSGGQDSRLLLAELRAQGANVIAVTFGSTDCPDVPTARRVARVAGIPHKVCDLNTQNWWQHRDAAIWQTDGLVNAIHLHAAITMEAVHVGNWYSPVNIAGDLLFGGSQLTPAALQAWGDAPRDLLAARYRENPFFGRSEVFEASSVDVERYVEGPSPDCFVLHQRLRRMTLTGPLCLAASSEMGFAGVGLATLKLVLGGLPDEARMGHGFYNAFLVRRHPRYFADIPWQATGRGLAESRRRRLLRAALRRVRRLSGHKIQPRRATEETWFVDYPRCLQEARVRERLLGQDLLIDEPLGGRAREILAGPAPVSAPVLVGLLTVETYLRRVAGISPALAVSEH